MKTLTLVAVVITASLFPALTFSAQESGQASPSQAELPAVNIQQFEKQMAQMQETMKKMQEQMRQIQKTKDPQERQNLLQQHQAMMQNGMAMMGQMWGKGTMGCCAGGGMMGQHMMNGGMMGWDQMREHYSNLTPEQMKEHQYMRDQYMGMQQMMMDQMMQHQHHMGMQPR
ncbi:hypothetical protein [Pseudomonas sp. B392_1p]|uniref:hypothetical protein n=1 Tax=Pseudomonas sp. B392_1p TaxID=3457507 RepID=UPI003FD3AC0A